VGASIEAKPIATFSCSSGGWEEGKKEISSNLNPLCDEQRREGGGSRSPPRGGKAVCADFFVPYQGRSDLCLPSGLWGELKLQARRSLSNRREESSMTFLY